MLKEIYRWKPPESNYPDIIVAKNDNNELKIGTDWSMENRHMSTFYIYNGSWSNLVFIGEFGIQHLMIHWFLKDGGVWCNIGEDLPITDNEPKYIFVSDVRLKTFERLQHVDII